MGDTGATQRLLILACSQRKRPGAGLLPAIERYDGVNFRVLRKAMREGYWPGNLDVLILSAKYGLIKLDTPIENYNLKMTRKRALTLQSKVSRALDILLEQTHYSTIFVNLGSDYLASLEGSKRMNFLSDIVIYATGGIGVKMSTMKKWLHHISLDDREPCYPGGSS